MTGICKGNSDSKMNAMIVHRRGKILEALDESLIFGSREYVLPTFDDAPSPFTNLSVEQQQDVMFDLVRNCCLEQYSFGLYPFWSSQRKIKFKIGRGAADEVKHLLLTLVPLLRPIIFIRISVCEILTNPTSGLITREVAEIIKDYLNNEFPKRINDIFDKAQRSLFKVASNSLDLQIDLSKLEKTLFTIHRDGLIGGCLIDYLERPEIKQLRPQRSDLPKLFRRCVDEGMNHYNKLLQDFLYNGHLNNDRQHEFPIWDLSKSKVYKASQFSPIVQSQLPFDQTFVLISELIPECWRTTVAPKLLETVMDTRRQISVLVSLTRKSFHLKYVDITDLCIEEQMAAIHEAHEESGAHLLKHVDSKLNIKSMYRLLYELIFNSSSAWASSIASDMGECEAVNPLSDFDLGIVNSWVNKHLEPVLEGFGRDFEVFRVAVFKHGIFDKVLPHDTRIVDYLKHDWEALDGILDIENIDVMSQTALQTKSNDDELPFLERIGLEFKDNVLIQLILSPRVQEGINRLFRLKIALARADWYLSMCRCYHKREVEMLFVTSVHTFIRRYAKHVFGTLAEDEWNRFSDSMPKLTSVKKISHGLQLLVSNMSLYSGITGAKEDFASILDTVLTLIFDYAAGRLSFDDAADKFYPAFKKMSAVVSGAPHLQDMKFSVFRTMDIYGASQPEATLCDPRKEIAPPSNLLNEVTSAAVRRSVSLMSLQKRR